MNKESFNRHLKNFQKKDYDDFEDFYNDVRNIIYGTAVAYVKNYVIAEDIKSDVMLKILKYCGDEVRNPKAWIIEITKNTALNYLKKQNREVITDFEENEELVNDGDIEKNLVLIDLERILTEREFMTVIYIVYSHCTYREIATILEVSSRQVQRYYESAKKKIKNFYKQKDVHN